MDTEFKPGVEFTKGDFGYTKFCNITVKDEDFPGYGNLWVLRYDLGSVSGWVLYCLELYPTGDNLTYNMYNNAEPPDYITCELIQLYKQAKKMRPLNDRTDTTVSDWERVFTRKFKCPKISF